MKSVIRNIRCTTDIWGTPVEITVADSGVREIIATFLDPWHLSSIRRHVGEALSVTGGGMGQMWLTWLGEPK